MPFHDSELRSFHCLVTGMHISHVRFHLSEVFIRFGLLDKRGFVRLQMFHSLVREQCIALPARGFRDMVLGKPVDEIDIRPQQVLDPRHLLNNEIAVMQDEFQIQGGDGLASQTGTICLLV